MEEGRIAPGPPTLAALWAPVVAVTAAAVVLVRLGFQHGGYFPPDFLEAGIAAFAVVAVLLAVRPPSRSISTESVVAVAALTALAAWTGLSALWAPEPEEALLAFARALGYVAFFGLALIAAGSGRTAQLLPWAALAVAVVLVGTGVLSRIQPDHVTAGANATGDYRLAHPFGYWNAFGGMSAIGAILAIGLAADPRARIALRGAAAAAGVLLGVGLWLSLSRGGWLALLLGLALLLVLGAHRTSLLTVLVIIGGATALAVLRLESLPALVDSPTAGDGQEAAGQSFTPFLVLLMGGTAVLVALLARAGRMEPELESIKRMAWPAAIGLSALVVCVGLLAYVVKAGSIESNVANGFEDTSSWISNQWDDFLNPSTAPAEKGSARLTSAKGTRSDLYRVAIDGFESDPLRGDGAGGFEVRWARERDVDEDVQDAHSLLLETGGELGLPGLLLLLAFLGAILRAAVRARLRPGGLRRSQAAAVGAAFIVFVAHAGVDWDWQMPAVTGTAMLIGAAVLPLGRERRRRERPGPAETGYGARTRQEGT